MSNPRQYKIPDWFLNRQKDIKDGKKTNPFCYVTKMTSVTEICGI